jgi:aspartokinase
VTQILRADRETEFEKRRGVSRIEARHGFAQVHISQIEGDVMQGRLYVLQAVSDSGISIDFLKLSPSGMSFLVPEDQAERVQAAIVPTGAHFSVRKDRSILLVHAVNIRDEEGMIATLVQTLIGTGAAVDHLGDMHDRMLMVLKAADVERVAERFRELLTEVTP